MRSRTTSKVYCLACPKRRTLAVEGQHTTRTQPLKRSQASGQLPPGVPAGSFQSLHSTIVSRPRSLMNTASIGPASVEVQCREGQEVRKRNQFRRSGLFPDCGTACPAAKLSFFPFTSPTNTRSAPFEPSSFFDQYKVAIHAWFSLLSTPTAKRSARELLGGGLSARLQKFRFLGPRKTPILCLSSVSKRCDFLIRLLFQQTRPSLAQLPQGYIDLSVRKPRSRNQTTARVP